MATQFLKLTLNSLKQEKGEENNALVIEKNDNKNTQTI